MTAAKFAFPEQGENRRKTERFGLLGTTTVGLSGQGFRSVGLLEDISYGGLRLRTDGPVPKDGPVAIEHEAFGSLSAVPVWYRDRTLGIQFERDGSELGHALQCVALMLLHDGNDLE